MPRWPGGVAVRAQAGSRTRSRPTPRARAQVAYARWLVTWGMELEDKKLRPSGSPPRDGVLADLAHQLCAFPAHAPDCKFATFYGRAHAQRAHPTLSCARDGRPLRYRSRTWLACGVHPLVHLFDNCQEASARSAGTSRAADLPRATLRTSKRACAVLLRVARLCARRCGVILAHDPARAADARRAAGPRSAKLAPQPPPAAGGEVYVVVVDRTAAGGADAPLTVERLPAGFTRGELAARLVARAASPTHLRVLVRARGRGACMD